MSHVFPRHEIDAYVKIVAARAQQFGSSEDARSLEASLSHSLIAVLRNELRNLSAATTTSVLPPALANHAERRKTESVDGHAEEQIVRRGLQWQQSVLELLDRLEHDWPVLTKHFSLPSTLALRSISEPLGDPHNHGRSVFKVRLNDGSFLIYKPRSVDTEDAMRKLLAWWHHEEFGSDFAWYRSAPQGLYGWTEFIDPSFCDTAEAAKLYYRRQGELLALFWLVGANDATSDNLIARGPHPTWIDTECICQPEIVHSSSRLRSMPDWIRTSILTTGMIACGGPAARDRYRPAGLSVCCVRNRAEVFDEQDQMKPQYILEVVQGFREAYLRILDRKHAWMSETGPLAWLRGLRVRVLLRSTRVYAELSRLLVITGARKGSDIWQEVQNVLRSWDGHGHRADPWPNAVVQAEMAALERGDVPYWTASTDSRKIREADGVEAPGVASLTGMECIARRLRLLGANDLERQVWLIESFLGPTGSRLYRS